MKKILLVLLLVLPLLLGQTVHVANSVIAEWDPPTQLEDGTPIVDLTEITYEVIVAPVGNKANFTFIAEVATPTAAITFPQEGEWLIAVRAVRTIETHRFYSSYLWSDETGNPFIVVYGKAPGAVSDLRIQ
jgi:hypothetical protein